MKYPIQKAFKLIVASYSINTVVVKEQVLKLLSIFFFVEVFSKLGMGQNVVFVTLDPIQFLINKSLCVIHNSIYSLYALLYQLEDCY